MTQNPKSDTNIKFLPEATAETVPPPPYITTEGSGCTPEKVSSKINVSTKSKADVKRIMHIWKKQNAMNDLKQRTEAEQVILDKIAHYTKTGNVAKLNFYKAKLEQNKITISIIKGVLN